jgi:hypothetical protein
VTGGIPDGEIDGLVLIPCAPESLLAPGIPVHGIVGVLQQIGALLLDETVGLLFGFFGERRNRGKQKNKDLIAEVLSQKCRSFFHLLLSQLDIDIA